jgi:hypothetical protein
MKTSLYTFFEQTIIDNIDLSPYDLSNDAYLYDKIKTTYNIFKKEYVHESNKRLGEVRLFKEWLQGLPSILSVPFYNHEILQNAKKAGFFTVQIRINDGEIETVPSEGKNLENLEERFLASYWERLANAFFTLKDNLQISRKKN